KGERLRKRLVLMKITNLNHASTENLLNGSPECTKDIDAIEPASIDNNQQPGESDPLEMVFEFLETHPDKFDDETAFKIRARAKIVEDSNYQNKIVFDVERHRAWLGERYHKGQAMNSFITYWRRYVFDPSAQTLSHVGIHKPSRFNNAGAGDLVEGFDFNIQKSGSDKYFVAETFLGSEVTVTSLSEAEEFAETIVNEINLEDYTVRFHDALGPNQLNEFLTILKDKATDQLKCNLRKSWADFLADKTRRPKTNNDQRAPGIYPSLFGIAQNPD
ncbi:MAG TPA: hypothetical protein VK476_04745, partial [Flavobacterium sp.]|nr:hypothetical protein [Flavobacterium sp.]